MENRTQIRAVSAPWHRGVSLLVKQGNSYGVDVVLEEVEQGAAIDPTFTIDTVAAQALMDDLWNAGLRPTEGSGSAGSLRATQDHVRDLRKIAFKSLGIEESNHTQ